MSTTHNDPTAADVPELGGEARDDVLRAVIVHSSQPWAHLGGASADDIRRLLTLHDSYVDEWIAHAHREGLIALVSRDGQTERWVPTEAGRARFASLPPKRLPGDRSDPPVVILADEYLPPWDAGLDNRTRAGVDLIVQIIGDASGGDARGAVTEGYVRSALRALAAAAPTDQGRWLMAAKDTGMVNAVYGSARPVELTGLGRDHYATLTDRQQILDRIGRELAEVRRIAKDKGPKGPSVRRAVWEWAKADLRNTTPLGWLLGLLRTGVFAAGVVVWYQLAGPFFVQLPGGAEPAAAAPPGWVDGFTVGALSTVAAAFAVAAYVWPSPPRRRGGS